MSFTHEPEQFCVPAGQVEVHTLFVHTSLAWHCLPQEPQLLGSVLVSAQPLAHCAKPALQALPQVLAVQVAKPFAGASHCLLQPLQLLGSFAMSAQRESHGAKPAVHEKPHFESLQVALPCAGIGHALPQSPQLPGEEVVSMQAPPQLLVPVAQVALQLPSEHTKPAPQAVPQAPQCAGSLCRSMHWPEHWSSPWAHATWHCPFTHSAMPPVGAEHSAPHLPQFCGSL